MTATAPTKKAEPRKKNRRERRGEAARQRRFNSEIAASDRAYDHEERKTAIAARVKRQQDAAHARKEARDKVRKEIAAKEGVAVHRVVLTSKADAVEVTYHIKADRSGIARVRQEKRHKRHQSFLERMKRRAGVTV